MCTGLDHSLDNARDGNCAWHGMRDRVKEVLQVPTWPGRFVTLKGCLREGRRLHRMLVHNKSGKVVRSVCIQTRCCLRVDEFFRPSPDVAQKQGIRAARHIEHCCLCRTAPTSGHRSSSTTTLGTRRAPSTPSILRLRSYRARCTPAQELLWTVRCISTCIRALGSTCKYALQNITVAHTAGCAASAAACANPGPPALNPPHNRMAAEHPIWPAPFRKRLLTWCAHAASVRVPNQ